MDGFKPFQKLQLDAGLVGKLFRSKGEIKRSSHQKNSFEMPAKAFMLLTALREPEDCDAAGWPHSFVADLLVNEKVYPMFFGSPIEFWRLFGEVTL